MKSIRSRNAGVARIEATTASPLPLSSESTSVSQARAWIVQPHLQFLADRARDLDVEAGQRSVGEGEVERRIIVVG